MGWSTDLLLPSLFKIDFLDTIDISYGELIEALGFSSKVDS